MATSMHQETVDDAVSKVLLDKSITLVPLFISSVAVSFDVGSFIGVGLGYFTFFSLTEHLLFSLEALPLALLFCFAGIRMLPNIQVWQTMIREKPSRGFPIVRTLIVFFVLIAVSVIPSIAGAAFQANKWVSPVTIAALLLLAPFVPWVAADHKRVASDHNRSKFLAYPIILYFILVLSLSVGMIMGTDVLRDEAKTSVTLKDNRPAIHGRIVRSGERGVLLYEPASRSVRFERWDAIQAVATVRP
jgi:hypothetical protein